MSKEKNHDTFLWKGFYWLKAEEPLLEDSLILTTDTLSPLQQNLHIT